MVKMLELTSDEINKLLNEIDPQAKAPHAHCSKCPLRDKKFVPSHLPQGAKIAIVSRSPGHYDTTGPFTGPSQRVVDYLLESNGHSRQNVALSNVVLCQTDDPPREAIAACRPRLRNETAGYNTIIAAGREAILEFTTKGSVGSARGYVHSDSEGRRIVATNNPALVLRESDSFPTLVTDFRLAFNPLPQPTFPKVEIINEPHVARDILREWNEHFVGNLSSDLEWHGSRICCAGFSRSGDNATVFGQRVISDPECFGLIKRLYESEAIHTTWHNGKSDTAVLWKNGIRGRIDNDTHLLSYALDEEPGRHSLDYCLQTELGWPDYEPDSVKHFKKTGSFDFYGGSTEELERAEHELYEYNGWDAAGTSQLFDVFVSKAKADGVYDRPYRSILLPSANAFRSVELRGFKFDAEGSANIMESEILPTLASLTNQMRFISKHSLLNPKSHTQLAALYYDEWGLRHALKNKARQSFSRSTGKEVRKEIEDGRYSCKAGFEQTIARFAEVHRRFARVERQRSNYFQPLIERVDGTGYIHPWFNIGGTVTGRPSSTEPNFQNITREGVEGISSVRSLFIPSEQNVLVQADYSQAELRAMAVMSGDNNLLAIYNDGSRSLHKERAANFYGPNYTKEEYVRSKNINFGVSYWQSAHAFAQMYHMDIREAQSYIDSWWREFPTLHLWTKAIARMVVEQGEVVSPHGYKRRFHLITKDNTDDIQREGINFLPQNTAVVFTLSALVELESQGVQIVNMVHDSLVADVPRDKASEVGSLIKTVMESQPKKLLGWTLPFSVDVSVGDNWAEMEEL
jgi:DNA polymerase I